jgi:predicted nucleic-acid-binding protein
MIGLDTNIVVRYLTHDDPSPATAAVTVMDSLSSGFTRVPFPDGIAELI